LVRKTERLRGRQREEVEDREMEGKTQRRWGTQRDEGEGREKVKVER
jgi:hypothetical protein